MQEDWNYLIVLDACRYDYFAAIYKDFLSGALEKVISLGTTTIEWCRKNFTKHYDDVVYVSANPYINSIQEIKGFKANSHFFKVIDVWRLCWNEKLGTVHPKDVNKFAKIAVNTYKDKHVIVHYLQPHAPYIGYEKIIGNGGFPKPEISSGKVLQHVNKYKYGSFTESFIKTLSTLARYGKFTDEFIWNTLNVLNLPPYSPMDAARRVLGKDGLRIAYCHNLTLVLKYVSRLLNELSGKVIITSDHGELLGEEGKYSHTSRSFHPKLIEVPWLVLNN